MKIMKVMLLGISLAALGGCAQTVKPWERENLAKTNMQWETDSMQSAFDRHVYFSKEAASGGTTTAGGGCGCN